MRPFWLEDALFADGELAPALQGQQKADVGIVGGGFTGLWTAIQLKQQNPTLDIAIIESDLCGAGASGRNGGCLLTWSTKFFTLRRLFGEDEAVRLVKASEEVVNHIGDFCREHRINAEFRQDGTLYTATTKAQLGVLDPVLDELKRRGISSYHALPDVEVRRRSGSMRNLSGVFSPMAATVHPGKLVRGLRRVAIEMGIRIYERTPMLSFTPGTTVTLHTPAGSLQVGKMVLAINAWMASRFPQFERTLAVVSSDMVITEKCPELLQQIGLTDGVSVLDSRTFVFYYRTTEDGRLMLGKGGNTFAWRGRILPVFDQRSPYEQQLKQSLHEFFPALADVPITASWNGPSDRSVTGFPFFGRLNDMPNVFYGFGYSGNGVGPSYMGGQLLSSLVLGLDNAWSRSPLAAGPRGHFPPEPLRYIGSLVVRNAIRRKELAEDQDRKPWMLDQMLSKLANAAGKADKA
ncbi:NAD(P)-binding Rossmann-like domain protein [Collimonas arenae]|uniref:NAD(P)-binding Rossmann-like domain protein n=1 Tax=Collimonas arenae TaxID=279058 RepID=A0A127PLP5_9BURK|nr:FAD-dependent oxidoreductase [Collimonas arenae]AMO98544.1 NAD(P)-binding Rossmann-like domain protein [Collimonas arenae]AMP08430.1 NAD(P)-binding Rossmann-like domain protein [Collimonas arenae]